MLTIRKSEQRGHANHGWLDTYHTFSFASYQDPAHMGFRSLRVINQDRVQGGMGFGTHAHRDMEIITYMVEGSLEHKDSMGNGSIIHAGEVQRLTAGTGITHSEFNHSKTDLVHLLQIWIFPDRTDLEPGYEQKMFSFEEKHNQLRLIVSRDGRDRSVQANQDVNIYASILAPDAKVTFPMSPNRYAWLQVARGSMFLNGEALSAGDGVAVSEAQTLELVGREEAEVILFDLA